MLFASWLVALGACGAIAWTAHVVDARRAWGKVGTEVGLELDTPRLTPPRLRGSQQGFEIVVSGPRQQIQIQGVDPGFTLGRDSAMARSIKPDIETGDGYFDEIVRIEGDRDHAFGLLHDATRRLAVDLIAEAGVELEAGCLVAKVGKIHELPELLPRMLRLAELLQPAALDQIPARLESHAQEDPSPGFRLQAFRHLVSEFHGTDEARIAARALLTGGSTEAHHELRLEAARALLVRSRSDAAQAAEDQRMAISALSELAAHRAVNTWLRHLALEQLARSKAPETAVQVVRQILLRRDESPEMCRAAIVALVEAGAPDELLTFEPRDEPTAAEALAFGLGEIGDARAQPRLLELLDHPAEDVRIAAAKSLGAVGDVQAVPALRRAMEDGGILKTRLSRAATLAVETIQQRAGGTQAGEIALVVPEPLEGAVSAAEDASRGGEVSMS